MEFLKRLLIGKKRDLNDHDVFHKVSLIAFLAWVGLGADGLSSSAYGPEEAFKALGPHTYLAVALAIATAFTVLIISYAYTRIIEHFPFGGGGYVVASRLLGKHAGLVSGSALVIDYILTISISIAAGADAVFSFLPASWNQSLILGFLPLKLYIEMCTIVLLIILNLRGVKESVTILTPIFLVFLVTHVILIVGAIVSRFYEIPIVVRGVQEGFSQGLQHPPIGLGLAGMVALLMRAYSLGGGTYTGIEAVSNGLMIMREPKVETGKKTMVMMALSLALTASGLVIAYLLLGVTPMAGKTMNAVLAEKFAGGFSLFGLNIGHPFILITLVSEAFLLFVAAQAGFIDGPRVMANMASDSWLPHRFSQLSERLTVQNGILLMGVTSVLALIYTRGDVSHLVVMYSINVFLTFSLTEMSMCRFWVKERDKHPDWKKKILIHITGLTMCLTILAVTTYEKFGEGGWITLLLTVLMIGLCLLIRRHYGYVQTNLKRLDDTLSNLPQDSKRTPVVIDYKARTAVLLVGSYGGLGVHSLLSIQKTFPGTFKNIVFVSIGVIDSAVFKNVEAVDEVREKTKASLEKYVSLAQSFGFASDYRLDIGIEAVSTAENLCRQISKEFTSSVYFAGKLIFEKEKWFQKILHNETAYSIQRRLQFAGLNTMVLPIRILESA